MTFRGIPCWRLRLSGAVAAIASAALVALCVGPTAPGALAQGAVPCAALVGRSIEPALMGLPSGPARIASASVERLPASPAAAEPSIAYCKVLGEIAPRDPAAPPIRFEINLPEQWNGKAVQYGGGGFNGVLIAGLNRPYDARLDTPVPVARGYATWGTDSGHDAAKLPEIQAFALNEEALENYAFASYKKVRDVAIEIVRTRYGTLPRRIYYYGLSEGGREGLTMAQRFQADFDGIVSAVPAINFTGLLAAGARNGIALMGTGWLSPAKVKTLHRAVLDACDAADGLADGIVSRYAGCTAVFDPKELRCPDGRDSDNCLTDAQIAAAETIHSPYVFPFPLANGVTSYPGYNYGGEDQPVGMVASITGPTAPAYPLPADCITFGDPRCTQGRFWYYGSGFVRYFLAGDPNLDPRKFRPEDFRTRIEHISTLMDSTDPDLSRFAARGGKLILKEHMSDYNISPFNGTAYYKSVVDKLGQASVDAFMRFYVTPGANHVGTGVSSLDGAILPSGVDLLEAIDGWVDRNTAPDALVQVAQDTKPPFAVTASRPMCRYPAWPRYKGAGSPKEAASFSCVGEND
jgi:Tannase and feruloyl esterase